MQSANKVGDGRWEVGDEVVVVACFMLALFFVIHSSVVLSDLGYLKLDNGTIIMHIGYYALKI